VSSTEAIVLLPPWKSPTSLLRHVATASRPFFASCRSNSYAPGAASKTRAPQASERPLLLAQVDIYRFAAHNQSQTLRGRLRRFPRPPQRVLGRGDETPTQRQLRNAADGLVALLQVVLRARDRIALFRVAVLPRSRAPSGFFRNRPRGRDQSGTARVARGDPGPRRAVDDLFQPVGARLAYGCRRSVTHDFR